VAREFIFVDETGDTGVAGGSVHFGMALLHVKASDYESVRKLLATIRWAFSLYSEIKLGTDKRPAQRLLEGLGVLSHEDLVRASGLCLVKEHYLGRYLSWCDLRVRRDEWSLYLRNYLLRHLLETHFAQASADGPIEVILDKVSLSEPQRANLLAYLSDDATIPRSAAFNLPPIESITIADSRYVGGLQVAHVLAEVVKDVACDKLPNSASELVSFLSLSSFLGKPPLET
jgi:hypothetical protein